MTRPMIVVAATATALLGLAAPAQASPGYEDDCVLPGVSTTG